MSVSTGGKVNSRGTLTTTCSVSSDWHHPSCLIRYEINIIIKEEAINLQSKRSPSNFHSSPFASLIIISCKPLEK